MEKFVIRTGVSLLLPLLISGCASHTHELKAANVSDAGYRDMSCKELHAEMQVNVTKVRELSQIINDKADDDQAQAAGAILFWPILFALEGGDGHEAAEYSRLKGEINTMEKVAILNDCENAQKVAEKHREDEKQARLAYERAKSSGGGGYKN